MAQPTKTIALINLNAATIPLTGRHLIEASAGTGKTYNITRIYLRLLLERELKVEEILVMTFTKDATQELRGRIDTFIREAINHWPTLCQQDPYFLAISKRVADDKIQFLLKRALLFLDEAAIFTLHGFCQRALNQHAFASGLPFNATMSTNSSELILQASQDWYRQLAKQNPVGFDLVAQFWSTPNVFVSSFAKAIGHQQSLTLINVQQIIDDFITLAKQAHTDLVENNDFLNNSVVAHKKQDEQEKRAGELVKMQQWFETITHCQIEAELMNAIHNAMPDYLLNGNRHPKAFKVQLSQIFENAKEVKEQLKNLTKHINKAKAYQLVRTAIVQIRQQVKHTKEQQSILDFDDLINTLANALQKEKDNDIEVKEGSLSDTLFAQYPVALVDEFQDTDPQQFSILQAIYYNKQAKQANGALYLIGDPKQAIYGFRGGDIFAYLVARVNCDYHWLMDTNWRSTPDMITACNQLFLSNDPADDTRVFGYNIAYNAVLAGKPAQPTLSEQSSKSLQFIHFSGEDEVTLQTARSSMATWCANEIVKLLSNTEVKPQDIAILVRDGSEASNIKQALLNAKLNSVYLSDRANLFHSEQASQLLRLLQGILSVEDERLYIKALACGLLGFNARALYTLQHDEIAYQALKFNFFDYRTQWQRQGFIAMAIKLMHTHFNLPIADKDRALTNLLHLFEILQSASQQFLQPQELLYWFEQQCSLDNNAAASELEAEQRLESDGDLIRIVTQHGAKGLEYPYVFIPFATRHKDPLSFSNKSISYIEYHDDQGKLCLSLEGDLAAKTSMANEAYAESIRLLYVAITRAEKRCYIFTSPFKNYALSPLGKTLQWSPEQNIIEGLQQLIDKSPQTISLEHVNLDTINVETVTADPILGDQHEPQVSKFHGKIERDWWLSSFSALSRNLRHGGVSTPDRDTDNIVTAEPNTTDKQPLLRFKLAKGAHSGNLLHDILEHSDFVLCASNQSLWQECINWPLINYGELTDGFSENDLIAWLAQIIQTPLISTNELHKIQPTPFCLADIAITATLRESEFYFPMKQASVNSLTILLTDHRKQYYRDKTKAGNNKTPFNKISPVRLPSYQSLKGMMHGFIDLVFEQDGKYYVCDYKSSHLGNHFSDYHSDALHQDIEKNYYDLQYLIYSLALHRYLQQNLPNYQVEQHFGGIYYLYLRGMTNAKDHIGSGIYYRSISKDELLALDNIFLGEPCLVTESLAVENNNA